MNFKILLLVTLTILKFINNQKMFQSWNVCGNPSVTSMSDCSVADLGTGFVCCYVTGLTNQPDTCVLVGASARASVKPPNYMGPGNIDCGLSSSFISMSMVSLISFIMLLVL